MRSPRTTARSARSSSPTGLAWLQGRGLVDQVIAQGEMGVGKGYEASPEAEILSNIGQRRFQPGTNIFEISLEGADPDRVKKLLTTLLEAFQAKVSKESRDALENAEGRPSSASAGPRQAIDALDQRDQEAASRQGVAHLRDARRQEPRGGRLFDAEGATLRDEGPIRRPPLRGADGGACIPA